MLTIIKNYDINDIKAAITFLLGRATESEGVRQLATSITADCDDPIAAIYDWVKVTVTYTPDPIDADGNEIELFISPVKMARDYDQGLPLAGDCDDIALLTTALYHSVGIKSNVVIIDIDGAGFDHAFSQAYSEKLDTWLNIDPASRFPLGWEESYKRKVVV